VSAAISTKGGETTLLQSQRMMAVLQFAWLSPLLIKIKEVSVPIASLCVTA
jgi:hypothetical protein